MTGMADDRLMLMYHSRALLLLHTLSPRRGRRGAMLALFASIVTRQ